MTTNQTLLTVTDLAAALSVTQACIRRWILGRKITFVKVGRLVRIPASEVQRIIDTGIRPAKEDRCQ